MCPLFAIDRLKLHVSNNVLIKVTLSRQRHCRDIYNMGVLLTLTDPRGFYLGEFCLVVILGDVSGEVLFRSLYTCLNLLQRTAFYWPETRQDRKDGQTDGAQHVMRSHNRRVA